MRKKNLFRCGLCNYWSPRANIKPSKMNEITRDEGILHGTKEKNYLALYRHSKSRQHLRVKQWLKGQKLHGLKEHEFPKALMENARGYKEVDPETNEWTITEKMLRTVVAEVHLNQFQLLLLKFLL